MDKVYLKKYALGNSDSLFYSTLPFSQRNNIDEFVKISDTLPIDSLEDLNQSEERCSIYLDYGNERHTLFIHSLNPPKAFQNFNYWVTQIIDSLKFVFIDTTIKFKGDQIIHDIMTKKSL